MKLSSIETLEDIANQQIEELKAFFKDSLFASLDPDYDYNYMQNPSDVVHIEALATAHEVKGDTLVSLGILTDEELDLIKGEVFSEVMKEISQGSCNCRNCHNDDSDNNKNVDDVKEYQITLYEADNNIKVIKVVVETTSQLDKEEIVSDMLNILYAETFPEEERSQEGYHRFHASFKKIVIVEI